MRCYKIDLTKILRIILLGKESLHEKRLHYTRYVSEYLMYAVTSGELKLSLNGKPLTLGAGDIYIFKKGDRQAPLESCTCEYYYVHFLADDDQIEELEMDEREYLSTLAQKRTKNLKTPFYRLECYDFMSVCIKEHTHVVSKSLFEYIVNVLKSNRVVSESKSAQKRYHISAAFAEMLFKLEESDETKPESFYATTSKITQYVEKNYATQFDSADVEKALFLNFDYANRLLSKALGVSIMKYRNIVRINHAKVIIRTSNTPLSEIAIRVGFESAYYFSRVFKKLEGISPSEYKQEILYGKHTAKK